ncbi:MAG: DUF58 domain-containing protein [Mastigocoleus sp. MO_167.B18]|nr:DUF58 domain-containing protein [Mastigocoleus sp. MO_167.B18]
MNILKPIINWLEIRACAPTYSGMVLAAIAICFFAAAINTMAGWLYVISGVSFALLVIAAFLPPRSLSGLSVTRFPIAAVTAGDDLTIELEIINSTKRSITLLQVKDILPYILGQPISQAIEIIPPQGNYHWRYYYPTQRRGVYRWHNVELATGAPFGLFWSRRQHECNARVIVYPTVLPLNYCPLVDEFGTEDCKRSDPYGRPFHTASEGLTRSLRPYRIGDPMRLIHWRSSARMGDLRVRELELITGGQEIAIALDTCGKWEAESFEQAVIAAASMYFYAQKNTMQVQLWTAATNLVRGERLVLETLAASHPLEDASDGEIPKIPLIWLTQNPLTLSSLPVGSRWVLWQQLASEEKQVVLNRDYPGIAIDQAQELKPQLQKNLTQ